MSAGHIKGWGNWQEKLEGIEQREEKNWNRKKYGEMSTKRVEWFVLTALIGLFVILVGIGMIQYVGRARRMAHVSNVNAIRTALQYSFTTHEDELKRDERTKAINFYISPLPEQIPDDENGAVLRKDIDSLLVSCGVYRYRISGLEERIDEIEKELETEEETTEETGWIYEIRQESGTLTVNYWSSFVNYEKDPEKPDCIFHVSGPSDGCLASLEGSYE